LVYGQHMVDFLDEKGVLDRLKSLVITGNYRLEYYLENKASFDRQASLFFPNNGKKTILYAPTWAHPSKKWEWRADFSNFFDVYPYLFDHIPDSFQLLVKLHPFLVHLQTQKVEEILERYSNHPQITFIHDFPPIYPLLQKADCYLGDYSSIGYDFLAFDRPLFFLTNGKRDPLYDKGVYLQQCGIAIPPQNLDSVYKIIEENLNSNEFSNLRRETYHYAFGPRKKMETLKHEIEKALS
jgi:CDP-glycerol glycerophosphotransferase (TagB/SpsB family)